MDDTFILEQWIERLKALGGPRMGARVAEIAAPLVNAAVKKTADAGQTPMGAPWPPKKDGGRPLAHAGDHIRTEAIGNLVYMTLPAPDSFHHFGAGNSPRRQVIPDGVTIPKSVHDAVEKACRQAFDEVVAGRLP
jgi:hypothetical protein